MPLLIKKKVITYSSVVTFVYTFFSPTGYGGNNCENNINNCAGITCPSASTCVDVVNGYHCRCNLGLTGEGCSRGRFHSDIILR